MSDIVERLREYALNEDHERGCKGREYSCTCGYDDKRDPLLTEAADTITTHREEHQKLNERNAEYIGTIDRLRRRVAETDVENERLRAVMKTAIRQFEDGNLLSCHRTLCDEVHGRQK